MRITILDKKTSYRGRIFDIEQLRVRLPDEREQVYDLVNHRDSVTILPLDDENKIWFVRQFRMGCQCDLLELPAGVINDGESAEECARREIREEVGYSADSLLKIGEIYLAPGYINEKNHIFLARQLKNDPLQQDEDEFLERISIPLEEAYMLARAGNITDSKSLAALLLAESHLRALLA